MKRMIGTFGSRIVAGILFSAFSVWAVEPPPGSNVAGNGRVVPRVADAPSQSATSMSGVNPGDGPAASTYSTNGTDASSAVANSPPAVSSGASPSETGAGTAPPQPASPNSVAASPYGAPAVEAAVPASPRPAPPKDGPATLWDSNLDYAIGGFGGLGVMYTRFAGHDQPLLCFEGALIIDHAFTLGGGGCIIPDVMKAEHLGVITSSAMDRLEFGYGGAVLRYHFFSRRVVNLAVGALIGAGGLVVGEWDGTGNEASFGSDNYTIKTQDGVFVVEPQIGGYANLTRWLRVGGTMGYRLVSGVELKGLSNTDVMGPTVGGQIQAGWF